MIWPLEIPTSGVSQQQFELQRNDYLAPEASGRIGGVQAGFPLWQATWTIGRIGADKSDAFRAFLLRLRGTTRRFLGYDQGRPYPKAHIAGFTGMVRAGTATPFNGDATSWTETVGAISPFDVRVDLQGLPAGLTLSVGDYIGFRWAAASGAPLSTWHAPVRIVEGGVANSSGAVQVYVEPGLPSVIPPTATAYLTRPACVFVLVPDKSELQAIDRRLAIRGGTITAVQELRA